MTRQAGRILVVDDSQLERAMLTRHLEGQGHTVVAVEQGRQALDVLKEQAFDLVLLDIVMSDMDGYQVLEHIRADAGLRRIPVIVVSAVEDTHSALRCIELGAEDYVSKPFDPVLLRARVGACLERKRLRDQEQAHLRQLQQRNEALDMLNQMGRHMSSMLDVQQIVQYLPRAIVDILGAQGATLWLWDQAHEGWLVCQAAFFHAAQLASPVGLQLEPGQGVAGWAACNKKGLIVPRVSDDERFFAGVDRHTGFHTVASMAAPLWVHFAVIGVVEVVNKLEADFNADDLAMLEALAASAAIAIDNAVLFDARRQLGDELKTRNEELDAFAHTVAHDLKGALTNIIGFASVVRDSHSKLTGEQVQSYLHLVAQSGQKMASIIDELLLLASLRKMARVDMHPLDMASITAAVKDRLLFTIEEYQAQLVLPEPNAWPTALGHAAWVEEVWTNYVSNAIKYGGQPPRVELGFDPLPGALVRFWVRDNGPGLAAEAQARLFTPFERLHQVRAKGHGLGLSIVQRIVDKLGGQVGVDSTPGHGSLFWFTLPRGEDEA